MSRKSRRKVLKAITAGSTLGVASGVGAAMGSAQKKTVNPSEAEPPYPDVEYKTVGEDVWEAVGPQYWLLTIDRSRLDELLKVSPGGDELTQDHAETIDEIRDYYEIEQLRRGNELIYTLSDQDIEPANKDRRSDFQSVAGTVLDGLAAESDSGDPSVTWEPDHHEDMTHPALADFEIAIGRRDDIAESTPQPDEFGCEECSFDWLPGTGFLDDFLVDAIAAAVNMHSDAHTHEPYHFYWPDPPSIDLYLWEIGPSAFGGAPGEAQYMMDQAYDSSFSTRRDYLGYALHYVQDMGVPLHTGAVWQQLNPDPQGCSTSGCDQYFDPKFDLHFDYEEWAADNFEDADWYLDEPFEESFNDSFPYHIPSVEEACKDLAEYTTQYATTVFEELLTTGSDNPSLWDSKIYELTHNCMYETGGYTRGLITQFYDIDSDDCEPGEPCPEYN
ncbi:phospholipase C/P1 nuclease family protein [Natrialba magadii]|nr:hypothetical protein [Natrialba magadii]